MENNNTGTSQCVEEFVQFLRRSGSRTLAQLGQLERNNRVSWENCKKEYLRTQSIQPTMAHCPGRNRRIVPRQRRCCKCLGKAVEDCGCTESRTNTGTFAFIHANLSDDIRRGPATKPPKSSLDDKIENNQQFTERRRFYEEIKLNVPDPSETATTGTQTTTALIGGAAQVPVEKLVAIKVFREQNRDACMSPLNQYLYDRQKRMQSECDGEGHRCVHQYKLNARDLLEPLLLNEEGQSVCSDCGHSSKYLERDQNGVLMRRHKTGYCTEKIPEICIVDAKPTSLQTVARDIQRNRQSSVGPRPEYASSYALTRQRRA